MQFIMEGNTDYRKVPYLTYSFTISGATMPDREGRHDYLMHMRSADNHRDDDNVHLGIAYNQCEELSLAGLLYVARAVVQQKGWARME